MAPELKVPQSPRIPGSQARPSLLCSSPSHTATYRSSPPAVPLDTSHTRRQLKANLEPFPPQASSSSSGLAGNLCPFPCVLLVIRSYSFLPHFLCSLFSQFLPWFRPLLSLFISEDEMSHLLSRPTLLFASRDSISFLLLSLLQTYKHYSAPF